MTTTPRRLGRYELRQLLGHGSAGEVWKGYDLQRRQDVAVKLLHPDLLQFDPNFINLFLKEWQFIIALHHPNIVQVHDANVTRSNETRVTTPYIVMDYIEGHTTLADVIQRTSRVGKFLAVADIVHIFSSIGEAVDYAHEQQIFHDDIKPSNILLDTHNTKNTRNTEQLTNGEPMLTDFGIARLPINEATLSPLYMSPEQVIGRPSHSRSDIYALGVMLYEICTGVLPFHGESNVAIMMHHINTLPTPPMLINPNIPPDLSEVILRAMAKDPNARFATASLLASALAEACAIAQDPHLLDKKARTAEATGEVPLFSMSSGPLPLTSNQREQTTNNLPPILGVAQPALGNAMGIQEVQEKRGISAKIPAAQVPRTMFPLDEKAVVPDHHTLPTRQGQRMPSQAMPSVPPVANSDTLVPHYPFSTGQLSTGQLSGTGKVYTPLAIPTTPGSVRTQHGKKTGSSAFLSPLSLIIICLLLLLAVIGSLATSLLLHRTNTTVATPKPVVGHVFLQDDALGRDDTLRMEMQGIPAPAQGKHYFAWLQQNTGQVIPLGSLPVQNGSASLLYTGGGQHTNLLATMQAVIVTLEADGQNAPTTFHSNAKVYQASFAPTMLPYIQHILYSLPGFPARGGLSAGLFDTILGMNDKAASIVDSLRGKPADEALAIRQATRIIELIDGTQFARSSGDLPQALPSMLALPVGLISSATQQGYIDALATQVDKLKQVAGNNTELLRHIQNVDNALTDLRDWVAKMRTYDVQILSATNLGDPAIINVALQLKQLVQDAYTGRVVPPNDSPLPILGSAGATQAYAECQYLATLDVR